MDQNKRQEIRELLHYTNALIASMETAVAVNNELTMRYTSYWDFCRKYNIFVSEVEKVMGLPPFIDLYDIEHMPQSTGMLPMNQKAVFDSVHANLCILRAYFENKLGVIEDEVARLSYFLKSNLRRAIYNVPERELLKSDGVNRYQNRHKPIITGQASHLEVKMKIPLSSSL